MDIGQAIARERQRRQLSQADLGEAIGVHKKTISKWENGEHSPTRHLQALKDLLGIGLADQPPTADPPTDLSRMSYSDLLNLQLRIIAELIRRGHPFQPGTNGHDHTSGHGDQRP